MCICKNLSVCLIIGAYSKWLDAAPSGFSKLPSLIDILMSGMRTSEDSAAAAALAFRHICDGILSLLLTIFTAFFIYLVECYGIHPMTICLKGVNACNIKTNCSRCFLLYFGIACDTSLFQQIVDVAAMEPLSKYDKLYLGILVRSFFFLSKSYQDWFLNNRN